VELQDRYDDLKRQGLGLAAISYDSAETLKRFADARGITFPLITDRGSAIIKRYGLFNDTVDSGTRTYGVPWPGTFVLDPQGRVRARYFEQAYQERNSAASVLVRQGVTPFGSLATIDTIHLRLIVAVSDAAVAPGQRVSLLFEVTPGQGMHVYAPGRHSYQVVGSRIDPQPWLRVHPASYPASEIYHFKPLDERVEVYQKPFRLVQDVTILATPEVQKLLAGRPSVTISGRFEYQACDDTLCYSPQSVPVQWTLPLRPLLRE
jgi:hypothetical protein